MFFAKIGGIVKRFLYFYTRFLWSCANVYSRTCPTLTAKDCPRRAM